MGELGRFMHYFISLHVHAFFFILRKKRKETYING